MVRLVGWLCAALASGLTTAHVAAFDHWRNAPPDGAHVHAAAHNELDALRAEMRLLHQRLESLAGAPEAPPWTGPCGDCGSCNVCDCQIGPAQACGLYAGAAVVWAKPHMKESFQATSVNVITDAQSLLSHQWDYELAPRVWLGGQYDNHLGWRVKYWQFHQNGNPLQEVAAFPNFPGASATTVIFPAAISTLAPGDVLLATSSLEVHTLDLEGTLAMDWGDLQLIASGGLRYASLDQRNLARVLQGGIEIQSLESQREFYGLGLTVGADAWRGLGNGWALVGQARGALLFGDKTLRRTVVGDVTPPVVAGPATVELRRADEVSGIFELGLGVEWSRDLGPWGRLNLRCMYEGQLWTDAGAPTLTFLGFEGIGLSATLSR